MESFNLVELVRGQLTGDTGDKIASLLGESRDRTQAGIGAAIPGILSGLTNMATTTDGARRLSSAVDSSDSGILSNLSTLFGGSFSSDTGTGLLRSLLGGENLTGLSSGIGRSSGL